MRSHSSNVSRMVLYFVLSLPGGTSSILKIAGSTNALLTKYFAGSQRSANDVLSLYSDEGTGTMTKITLVGEDTSNSWEGGS